MTATSLQFDLLFNCTGCGPGHKFQNFRLSYTTSPNPTVNSGAIWLPLTPTAVTATYATMAIVDGRIEATGDRRNGDLYQVVTTGGAGITGFRLEALLGPDGHLGWEAPASNGNVVLTEFEVCAGTCSLGGGTPGDTTPPSVTPSVTGTVGSNGWFTSNVGVTWTIVDAESSTTSTGCDAQTVTADTAGMTFTCTATSEGGSTTEQVTVKRDATAPTLVGSRLPLANANGWNNTNVAVSFSCGDALSGVASCVGNSTQAAEGSGQSVQGVATDLAGNTASTYVTGINIDKTTPAVALTSPVNGASLALNQALAAAYSCSDALSGVVNCTGTSASGAGVNTASVGVQTFSVTVTDAAGNTSTASASYNVGYVFGGFRQPIPLPVSTFKAGSTIPVKFRLTDAAGVSVGSALPQVSVNGGASLGTATYEDGQYHFNLKTKGFPVGPLTITVSLGDGALQGVAVTLK